MEKNNKKSEIERLKSEIKRLKKELKEKKKYGLVWEPKTEDVVEMCKEKLPVLKEVKSKGIITDKEKPVNLLIEGDNYHALSVLNYTHAKKVDVIYIDPPYNTGNKDFIFNDRYVDKEDAYRHSKWLSFMEKRLKLAKNLLKDTGVIFISIDENEVAQLKLLLNEIFHERNFLSNIKLKVKAPAGVGQESYLFDICEYILVYARNYSNVVNNMPQVEEPISTNITKTYNKILQSFGKEKEINKITGGLVGTIKVYKHEDFKVDFIPSLKRDMRIYYSNFEKIFRTTNPQGGLMKRIMPKLPKEGLISIEYIPTKGRSKGKNFRYYFLNGTLIVWLKDSAIKDKETREIKKMVKNTNLWIENFHQGIAGEGGVEFKNGKKPIKLIKRLIKMHPNKNAVVLDFFAGSGTTGEAVLDLNEEDDGNRQFILCTNNQDENGGHKICTDICYPRLKNAIFGYKSKKGLGGNLKYFKTDFVDAEPTDKNKIKLTKQATEMLCIKEGTFDLVQDRGSFKIFKNSKHYTGIIFDQLAIAEFKEAIKDIKSRFSVYVFSLGDETFDEEFVDIKQKVKLSPIPETILRVYRRIFR